MALQERHPAGDEGFALGVHEDAKGRPNATRLTVNVE